MTDTDTRISPETYHRDGVRDDLIAQSHAVCDAILADRSASYWLQDAVTTALKRDSLDAMIDAGALYDALRAHHDLFEDALAMTCPSCQHCPPGFDLRAEEKQTCSECGETTV